MGLRFPGLVGSDAASMATEGSFLQQSTHPRAYGNFARVLGKYVRDDRVLTLPDAIRKLSKLPATNLKIRDRGELTESFYADIVIFDPSEIEDLAVTHASLAHCGSSPQDEESALRASDSL